MIIRIARLLVAIRLTSNGNDTRTYLSYAMMAIDEMEPSPPKVAKHPEIVQPEEKNDLDSG